MFSARPDQPEDPAEPLLSDLDYRKQVLWL
jgi:hypothetical protein